MLADKPVLAVVGLGAMGGGISLAALLGGIEVRVVDSDVETTAVGVKRLSERLHRHVDAGLLHPATVALLDQVTAAESMPDACAGADLVVEAVSEDWDIKRRVLVSLSGATDATIITNTSSFPIDELAKDVASPERFLGVHFFHPAEWIPGVEVVAGTMTSPDNVDLAMTMLARMSKQPVMVTSSPGFIANRLQLALFAECLRCVDEGLATPADIDRVVRSTFGFRLPVFGPFAVADMAGLDVYASILTTLSDAYGERFAMPAALRELVEQRRLGVKTGGGFAEYSPAEVEELTQRRDAAYLRLLVSTAAPYPSAAVVPEATVVPEAAVVSEADVVPEAAVVSEADA